MTNKRPQTISVSLPIGCRRWIEYTILPSDICIHTLCYIHMKHMNSLHEVAASRSASSTRRDSQHVCICCMCTQCPTAATFKGITIIVIIIIVVAWGRQCDDAPFCAKQWKLYICIRRYRVWNTYTCIHMHTHELLQSTIMCVCFISGYIVHIPHGCLLRQRRSNEKTVACYHTICSTSFYYWYTYILILLLYCVQSNLCSHRRTHKKTQSALK